MNNDRIAGCPRERDLGETGEPVGARLVTGGGDDAANMGESLRDGLIEVWLDGETFVGGYTLKGIETSDKLRWLAITMNDEHANARRRPTCTQPRSVKTGWTLREIARGDRAE